MIDINVSLSQNTEVIARNFDVFEEKHILITFAQGHDKVHFSIPESFKRQLCDMLTKELLGESFNELEIKLEKKSLRIGKLEEQIELMEESQESYTNEYDEHERY